jgi:hypothetical protein
MIYQSLREISDTEFLVYVAFLAVGGLLMVILAVTGLGSSTGDRILYGVVAAAMLGYAFYLLFVQSSGTVHEFYYVFVIPFLLLFRAVQAFLAGKNRSKAQAAPPAGHPAGGYPAATQPGNQAYGHGAPGFPAPGQPQPGSPTYSPAQPGSPTYSPAQPGSPTYSPAQPGSPTYSPAQPDYGQPGTAQPTAAQHRDGQPEHPGNQGQ